MSILETPRILFRGNMAFDPITTNNFSNNYDETDGESQLPQPVAGARAKVTAFRAGAISGDSQNNLSGVASGNWNPHGTHRSTFYDLTQKDPSCPDSSILRSEISGVDVGAGPVTNDPFVGAPARFSGMLVDVEPYGSISSQLFFDTMSFGIAGGCRILARRQRKVVARYINFGRNPIGAIAGVASVIWQTSFRTADLTIDAFDSASLLALQAALKQPGVQGITVRWIAYRTAYYDDPNLTNRGTNMRTAAADLIAKLTLKDPSGDGVWQPNPARTKMVGAIGLWRTGEPLSEPGDRALVPAANSALATAFARIEDDVVTLDLSNSTPETGLDLTKQDYFGPDPTPPPPPQAPLTLTANIPATASAPARRVTIGTLKTEDYDRAAYEATSGIVSFRGDWSGLPENSTLELSQDGTILLSEDPVRVIPIVNDIYVEEGQPHAVAYQIHVNGRPGGANQLLTVVAIDAEGNVVSTVAVAADDDGVVTLNLPASEPAGLMSYVPILPTQQPPTQSNGINTQLNTYVWVRRLSADPVTGRLPPTWDNVYTAVLANWNALAPCMDNWLDLHDEGQVRAYAAVLKTLTDPANFESFRFMPVTRDMTRGQRRLLYRFLDSPASPAHAEFEAQSVEKAGEPNFVALSRSLRKPSAGD